VSSAPATRADRLRVGLCTVPDPDAAARIAHALVEERLAACVNLIPHVRSTYRWHGKVEQTQEALLIIKTMTTVDLEKLKDRLLTLHPYDVPELLLLPVTYGLDKYLDWIAASVEGAPRAAE
jgi:periplasmic divalent cation tolerance protein